jgi:hypothetical protein
LDLPGGSAQGITPGKVSIRRPIATFIFPDIAVFRPGYRLTR